jgi:hypothetical protein
MPLGAGVGSCGPQQRRPPLDDIDVSRGQRSDSRLRARPYRVSLKERTMKKLGILGCLIAAVSLGVTVAKAAVTTNESVPLAITVFIPCANGGAGETVTLTGELHVLLTFTINGNNISGKTHFQPQGISGLGDVTGAKYQGTGVTQDQFKSSLQNGQFEESFVNNFRMIGQGPGNNFLVHENLHITVNANGDVTVMHDNLSVECK